MITEKQIEDTIYQLYKQAAIVLGDDVKCALEDALKREDSDLGKLNIEAILKNIELAEEKSIPMCQDTGLPIIFVKLGKVHVENLYEGIKKGVAKATAEVPLRPNVVDPITRKNSGNVGDKVPIVDTKGFGSENNNALKMALPAEGIEGVKDFVVETALKAGGKPCPPIVVGVGIGGSSDMALKLGKKALLGKVGERNSDPTIAEMELECLERINKDGKGPMGLGGRTTALDVKILKMDTHTAGLPVGVVIQCWADRHATARLEDN